MENVKIRGFLNVSYGDGSGYGDGYGDGSGYGYGSGSGSGDGYGSGYGSGDGEGSGYGDGDGDGSGDGSGSGYGDGSGSGIKKIKNMDIYMIDGVPTIITQLRANVAKGLIVKRDLTEEPTYVVKIGNSFAHGATLRKAREEAISKEFEDMPEAARLEAFREEFAPGEKRTVGDYYEWHHRLTGSCTQGRDAFAAEHQLKMGDLLTPEEFITLTENAYGGNIIRKLKGWYKQSEELK